MSTIPARASDTEKITINLGLVDLGQIDLLVQEGYYSNRTDLIPVCRMQPRMTCPGHSRQCTGLAQRIPRANAPKAPRHGEAPFPPSCFMETGT